MLRTILWPLLGWIERKLPQDTQRAAALVGRLLRDYAPHYWKRYVLSFGFVAVASGCTALSAYLLAHAVDQSYLHRNFSAILVFCVVIFVLVTAKGLAVYGQAVLLARLGNEITADNQIRVFERLLGEELNYFAERHSAEFVAHSTFIASAPANVLSLLVTAIGRDSLAVIGLVTVMAVQDPVISVVAFVVMPISLILVRGLVKQIVNFAGRQYAANTSIIETMQELVRGFRVIKTFTLEEAMRARVAEQVQASRHAADELARLSNRPTPLMEALGGIAIALLLAYSGYRVIYTNATLGEFASFIAAFMLAYEPAKRLARLNVQLSSGLFGVKAFYELVDKPAADAPAADASPIAAGGGRLEFRNVQFAYRDTEPVLRDMSFSAEPGRVTALVGPSGGGKSTAVSLILRLYDPQAGLILLDEQDIGQVSRRSLRRQMAYVGQDVFLFRASIRDNIRFGRTDAGEQDIVAAAKAAHAHDFIMSFPTGYDTPVGEHGSQLSTGQRQRISIARALLKDAPLILLDEPTAALDSESERHVQDAMARLCRNRTTMVIAHRLQTIRHADRILFIEDGRVVEAGTHSELVRAGGRYAAFYRLQFEGELARHLSVAMPVARAV